MINHKVAAACVVSGTAGVLLAVVWGVAFADPGSPILPNPDAGLTDQQRDEKYQRGMATAAARAVDYVREFQASGRDPRQLDRVPLNYLGVLEATTLQEAFSRAELVAVGRVVSNRFEGGLLPHNVATISVEEVLEGDAPAALDVNQTGGPGKVDEHEFLGETDGDPLVLKGDRVLLLLIKDEAAFHGFRPLYGMGSYRLEGTVVRAAPDNPRRAELEAGGAEQLLRQVRALAAAAPR